MEAGEPTPGSGDCTSISKTVWYRLVPDATGVITVSTAGSGFDTVAAVYTGSNVSALNEVTCSDDADFENVGPSGLEFVASAGRSYALQLGGYNGDSGNFQLSVTLDTSRTSVPSPTPSPTAIPTATFSTPTITLTPTATPLTTATPTPPAATATIALGSVPIVGSANTSLAAPGVAGARSAAGDRSGLALGSPGRAVADLVTLGADAAPTTVQLPLFPGSGYNFAASVGPDANDALAALRARLPAMTGVWVVFDPAIQVTFDEHAGLGGGNVTPAGAPLALTLVPHDAAGQALVLPPAAALTGTPGLAAPLTGSMGTSPEQLQIPVLVSLPVTPYTAPSGGVFAWLEEVYQGDTFEGYLRPVATYVPPSGQSTLPIGPIGSLVMRVSLGVSEPTAFRPAVLTPAWVQNFDPLVHIFAGPQPGAVDYGVAAPQFTTFVVVGPQVYSRVFVYNPTTANYGWIDVAGIGPSGPPPAA
jgi:hypothetical protein